MSVLKRVPLADDKDDLIERWIRSTPLAKQGGRLALPAIGKPVAERRGKASLPVAVSSYRRRVVVVTYYYKMKGQGYGKLHSHLNYIERPGAGEAAITPSLFNGQSDEVRGHADITAWQHDRHHFRILLAPNDGHRLDMKAYTREYMAELEKALGTKLEWMAGIHEKPDTAHASNQHAHIVIRGIDQTSADLVIDRDFIRHEMRRIAEELATRHLGQMSQREVDAYRERQAERAAAGQENYHSGHRPKAKSRSREGHEHG